MIHHYRKIPKQRMAEKLCHQQGLNPQPCAPLFCAQLLSLAFFRHFSALVKQLFSRITLRRVAILHGWGSKPASQGQFSIQTTPTPLLGLQHAANMPGFVDNVNSNDCTQPLQGKKELSFEKLNQRDCGILRSLRVELTVSEWLVPGQQKLRLFRFKIIVFFLTYLVLILKILQISQRGFDL